MEAYLRQPITELDFSDNAFGASVSETLKRLLTQTRDLQVLHLNNNGLCADSVKDIAQGFLKSHKWNLKDFEPSALRVLRMDRNRMDAKGALYIAKVAAAYSESFEELSLRHCDIRSTYLKDTMQNLQTCSQLVSLNLQDNMLKEEGPTFHLANSVKYWPLLKTLDVGDCLIGPNGSKALIRALSDGHTNLEKLNLSYNEIDTDTAALLPGLLRNKINLNSIDLDGNAFDPEGQVVEECLEILRSHGHPDAMDMFDEMDWP